MDYNPITLVTPKSPMLRPEIPRTMPERILIGVDFRQPSLAAAKWAALHFGEWARIELAHVLPVPEAPRFLQPLVPLDDRLVSGTDGQLPALRGFAETLSCTDLSVHVRVGNPPDSLAELAGSLDAGLVVAGRKAVDGSRGITLERLLRRLAMPALVLDGRSVESPRRILAAVDDAEIGSSVIHWAAALARYFGAELMVLHILSNALADWRLPGDENCDEGPRSQVGRSCHWIAPTHAWLRDLQRTYGPASEGRTIVAVGTPGPVILERARTSRADLIVLGRNGTHALCRTDMGSATRLVLRGAQVPVLVVPPLDPGCSGISL
jgi:nucleotide-binding universal stress UspA family protein